jgi:hypothetical protein
MSHLSSIKSHCDMRMYTEQSRFRSSDSTLRKFWSKDRIRRNFHVFRIERPRITSSAKKRSGEKACFFEVDSSDEDVKVSIVYSTCIASRTSTRLRREKMNWNTAKEIRSQYSRARKSEMLWSLRVEEFSSSMRRMSASDDHEKIATHVKTSSFQKSWSFSLMIRSLMRAERFSSLSLATSRLSRRDYLRSWKTSIRYYVREDVAATAQIRLRNDDMRVHTTSEKSKQFCDEFESEFDNNL